MAFTGKGTIFQRLSDGSVWESIANINNISGPSATRETVDVTTLDSAGGYREFIGSLRDGGDVSLNMNFDVSTYTIMKGDFESDIRRQYRIVLPDTAGTTLSFSGLVTDLPVDVPLDDKVSCDITIKISGQTTLTGLNIIESVETLANIPVANGTQLADVNLPVDLDVDYVGGGSGTISVEWNAGNPIYDGSTAGTYVFTGTLEPGATQINLNALTATVNVVVAAP